MRKRSHVRDWQRASNLLIERSANVTPNYKKGPKYQPENYRPGSLTSQVSKIMESLIRDAIIDHLQKHQLIKGTQHRPASKCSCLPNLLTFLGKANKYVDEGYPVDAVYLYFNKAVDKVPQSWDLHCSLYSLQI